MSDPKANAEPEVSTFMIRRHFDAQRDVVFRSWIEGERLMRWWGPAGMKVQLYRLDVRPGGEFLYGMQTPDGKEMWGKWIFREVTIPERLVVMVSFTDAQGNPTRHPMNRQWPLETLSTIDFQDQDGGTLVIMSGVPHAATDAEMKIFKDNHDSMQAGWTGTLDQLEATLK